MHLGHAQQEVARRMAEKGIAALLLLPIVLKVNGPIKSFGSDQASLILGRAGTQNPVDTHKATGMVLNPET